MQRVPPIFQPEIVACVLNVSDHEAQLEFTIFYSDREPVGPYKITGPDQSLKHICFNDVTDPELIPLGTDYASLIESDVPLIVQHTRLDSRQSENALMTTMAFAAEESAA